MHKLLVEIRHTKCMKQIPETYCTGNKCDQMKLTNTQSVESLKKKSIKSHISSRHRPANIDFFGDSI